MINENQYFETSKELETFCQEWENDLKKDQDDYWNNLSKEDQLRAFCSVIRRLYKAEIEEKGSYRYVLYKAFNFNTESYLQAQVNGFLELHNAIFDKSRLNSLFDNLITFLSKKLSNNPDEIKQLIAAFRKENWV
jgi:hypothetical protein